MASTLVKKKITAREIFNCDSLSTFINSIYMIMSFKGVSMSRFYMCKIEGIHFLTKLCFYRKTPAEIYGKISKNVMSHVDAEINILKFLKAKIIDTGISFCILELIYEKVCTNIGRFVPDAIKCERLMLDYKDARPDNDVEQLICKYNDLVINELAHDKCAFLVLEKCDISLDEYLVKSIYTPVNIEVFKSLLFMIIYTMYAIKCIYPNFRHYDLHTENIMLKFDTRYKFKTANQRYLIFHIDGERYGVPYFGIIPKIIDFGFSSLPEENIISNATQDRVQMFFRSENDLLFLFHFIHLAVSNSGNDKLGYIDKILRRLEPNRTYLQYYTEYIRKVESKIPTYKDMVKNKIFSEYKKISPYATIYKEFTPVF